MVLKMKLHVNIFIRVTWGFLFVQGCFETKSLKDFWKLAIDPITCELYGILGFMWVTFIHMTCQGLLVDCLVELCLKTTPEIRPLQQKYPLFHDPKLQSICSLCSQRPWDPMNDVIQYENDFIVQTKTKHRTPMVRTMSITNISDSTSVGHKRPGSVDLRQSRPIRLPRTSMKRLRKITHQESGSSTPDAELLPAETETSDSGEGTQFDAIT